MMLSRKSLRSGCSHGVFESPTRIFENGIRNTWRRWTGGLRPRNAVWTWARERPLHRHCLPLFQVRGLTLPNRVVVSPMCMYSATDGVPDDFHLVHLGSRAMGGAGLVLTEMTNVSAEGRITPGCTGIYTDEQVAGWKRIVEYVHGNSAAAIGIQMGHSGPKGSTQRLWEKADYPLEEGNWEILAPSPIPYLPESQIPREMTRADMDQVREEFCAATRNAEAAGFDWLELHMAHGYLLASFLSPLTNRRSDEYGELWKKPSPVPDGGLSCDSGYLAGGETHFCANLGDGLAPGGNTGDDAVRVAGALREAGCDLIDVSTGQTVSYQKPEYGRLYQTPFSDRIRREAAIPTMTVGGVMSYSDVNSIIAAGRADLAVIARAHLARPLLESSCGSRSWSRPPVATALQEPRSIQFPFRVNSPNSAPFGFGYRELVRWSRQAFGSPAQVAENCIPKHGSFFQKNRFLESGSQVVSPCCQKVRGDNSVCFSRVDGPPLDASIASLELSQTSLFPSPFRSRRFD